MLNGSNDIYLLSFESQIKNQIKSSFVAISCFTNEQGHAMGRAHLRDLCQVKQYNNVAVN